MRRAVLDAQHAIHTVQLETAVRSGNPDGAVLAMTPARRVMERTLEAIEPLLLQVMALSTRLARIPRKVRTAKAPDIAFNLDVMNPAALEWAKRHAGELIRDITKQSATAVRQTIVRAFKDSIPPEEAAKLIRSSIGLSESQALAVANFRAKIVASPGRLLYIGERPIRVPTTGMSAARLKSLTTQYSEKLTRARARTIARTETLRASNEGQKLLWEEAVQNGDLPKQAKRQWIGFDPCPEICDGLDGEVRGLDELFTGGYDGPPAHPNCRCTLGLVGA